MNEVTTSPDASSPPTFVPFAAPGLGVLGSAAPDAPGEAVETAAKSAAMAQRQANQAASIKAAFDNNRDDNVVITPVMFRFKTNKDLGFKRDNVTLGLPLMTIDGVLTVAAKSGVQGDKERKLLLEAVNEYIISQAKEWVDTNDPAEQEKLDFSTLSWEFIASIEATERRGTTLEKEMWDAFGKDYIAIMPGITGKTPVHCENAVKLYTSKFRTCATLKPLLNKLLEQLHLWAASTKELEELGPVYNYLKARAATMLAADEKTMLSNLGFDPSELQG